MGRTLLATLASVFLFSQISFANTTPDPKCELALKGFPIRTIEELTAQTVEEGDILKMPVGQTREGKKIVSTISSVSAYFGANLLTQFAKQDARDSAAYSASAPIKFLRDFGITEMSLLGPDLSKPNPFLDMPQAATKSPSEDKIDETNNSLGRLAEKMQGLIGADQKSALSNLLSGNFAKSVDQVEAKVRIIMTQFKFTKEMFAGFLTDKKFLQDIQVLLAGNLDQFEADVRFMDEIQARYRKARDVLQKLSNEGESIVKMKAAVLGTITDEYTKAQVEKEFVRFEQRVTDVAAGIAIADTFINMWEVIKDTHYELMAGITRALYFTVPIIGAQQQLVNALARQDRTRTAITTLDNTRNAMILQMNAMMKTAVEQQHTHDMKSIKDDAENLGQLLVGTILVQQTMIKNNEEKVIALQAAREKYRKISEDAQRSRQDTGMDPKPAVGQN